MAHKKDLIGKQIGLLTVIKELKTKIYSNGRKNYQYLCRCSCDEEIKRGYQSFLRKDKVNPLNCGCISRESAKRKNHGLTGTATYNTWSAMKKRCLNQNHKDYKDYLGRGITIEDKRWLDFENFVLDMGERPQGTRCGYSLSLDRIDNDRGYSKENCRWATPSQQASNRRRSLNSKLSEADIHTIFWMFECGGKTKAEIAREFDVARSTISRIINGKSHKIL